MRTQDERRRRTAGGRKPAAAGVSIALAAVLLAACGSAQTAEEPGSGTSESTSSEAPAPAGDTETAAVETAVEAETAAEALSEETEGGTEAATKEQTAEQAETAVSEETVPEETDTEPDVQVTDPEELYQRVIAQAEEEGLHWQFGYINDDDIPELFTAPGDAHASGMKVYTYADGGVRYLGEFGSWGSFIYYERQGIIASSYTQNGDIHTSYIRADYPAKILSESEWNYVWGTEDEYVGKLYTLNPPDGISYLTFDYQDLESRDDITCQGDLTREELDAATAVYRQGVEYSASYDDESGSFAQPVEEVPVEAGEDTGEGAGDGL